MMRTGSVLIFSLCLCAASCKNPTNPVPQAVPNQQIVESQQEIPSIAIKPTSEYLDLDSRIIVDRLFEELQKDVSQQAKLWSTKGYASTLEDATVVETNQRS